MQLHVLSLYVYVHIYVAAINPVRMHFERSGRAEIHGAVGDSLPKSCFFQLNLVLRQGMLQEMPVLIIGVKIQHECKGQGLDAVSRKLAVTNKLLINLDLEDDARASWF